jgi:prepilin-type N-terminal cleavage/methylation domain-containing protein
MRYRPNRPWAGWRFGSRGFSLLEILVAMAVLALVMAVTAQIMNGLLGSVSVQSRQMDAVAAARRAVDIMATDLQHAEIGNGTSILVPMQAGADLLALLALRRGPVDAGDHRHLALRYSTNGDGQLFRSYGSVGFGGPGSTFDAALAGATYTPPYPLSDGILAVSMHALADGTNRHHVGTAAASENWATDDYNGVPVPAGWLALLTRGPHFGRGLTNRARALEIWVAATSTQGYDLLESLGKTATVRGALGEDVHRWQENLDAADIPPAAKQNIRIINRTIPLP